MASSDNSGSTDDRVDAHVPEHWTLPRIATHIHRMILEPLGFERAGNSCLRRDELVRSIRFYALRSTVPQVQIRLQVGLRGLPDAVVGYRRDSLWTPLNPERGPNHYLRPPSGDPLTPDLVDDVSGPGVEFLLHAPDLSAFVTWAEEIHAGDRYPNWWRRFRPVLPQGTSASQAAAFAAALATDTNTRSRLASRVLTEERDPKERNDFATELDRIAPVAWRPPSDRSGRRGVKPGA